MGLFFFTKKIAYVSIIQKAKDFAKNSKENWKNNFQLIVVPEIWLKWLYFHSHNTRGYPYEEPGKKITKNQKLGFQWSIHQNQKNKKIPQKVKIWFINMNKCIFSFSANPISSSYFLYEKFQSSQSLYMSKSHIPP